MSKPVTKDLWKNYIRKADELLATAEHAAGASNNDAAVINAIHCAINALDAIAVFYTGRRHAGSHEGALDAVKAVLGRADFAQLGKQFGGLIALKNQVEYQPDLMRREDAVDAVKRSSRILSKTREMLPKG